ncbi:hypothetical protein [Pandoraea sp. NPDC090278]|uniref:hypothetical protein n=1 Tax=Pandoraea sp. NPDC090278 TaxID=3364391 RepID=UPI00383A0029
MDPISTAPITNKPLLPTEVPPDARSAAASTISSDLKFVAPASFDVVWEGDPGWKGRERLPELDAHYWLCDRASPEYERFKADFREAVKVRLDMDNPENRRDGLASLLRSCPQQFRGFPADEYLQLMDDHCPDRKEDALNSMVMFSSIIGSDEKLAIRQLIQRDLVSALGDKDERDATSESTGDPKNSLGKLLDQLGEIDGGPLTQFVLDLLRDIRDLDEKYRLAALRKYCEIVPERIQQISQSELQELPIDLALNDADTSGALKCLGEATGYVFLPLGIFADWEELAILRPDVPEDQKKRIHFANQLRQKIDKIADDGRDANFVLREVVLKLARLDEDTQWAGSKLLQEFFRDDLSRMVEALGPDMFHGSIKNYCEGAKSEFGNVSAEAVGRSKGNDRFDLLESLKASARARLKDPSAWSRDRESYRWEIRSHVSSLFDDKTRGQKRVAATDVLSHFGDWGMALEKIFAVIDLSAIFSERYGESLGDVVGTRGCKEWISENFKQGSVAYSAAMRELGIDEWALEESGLPDNVGEAFIIPHNKSRMFEWAVNFLMSICNTGMNGSGRAFEMPPSFTNLSWQDRADAMQVTVNWTMQPLNNDTLKKLKAMAASVDLRDLMVNTVTKRKFAEVWDEHLRSYMQARRMVRSN